MNKALSLFSGAGIGDIGFRAAGYSFILLSEIEPDRAQLAKINFPESNVQVGDIWKNWENIIQILKTDFLNKNEVIDLISCTAPCQGMSKSGQGTLLRNIRKGIRPKLDPRNRLILPALKIIKNIRPSFVVFENVCEMKFTVIEDLNGEIRSIMDIIQDELKDEYIGEAYEVEFADYGIPQRRKRLITVYTRSKHAIKHYKNGIPLIPKSTHAKEQINGKKRWVSVKEALTNFLPLDASCIEKASNSSDPFHRVSVLDQKKYTWIKHTPTGASAFDNQCVNLKCKYQGNKSHGTSKNDVGINQANKTTPLYCEKCGELLPRPYTINEDGSLRIMSGYTSAYKRMNPNFPSPALTRNFSFPCSDNKVHFSENRVLSLAEAFVVHTLSKYEYSWGPYKDRKGKVRETANDNLIRLVIGESIPPKFTELLGRHLLNLSNDEDKFENYFEQRKLF